MPALAHVGFPVSTQHTRPSAPAPSQASVAPWLEEAVLPELHRRMAPHPPPPPHFPADPQQPPPPPSAGPHHTPLDCRQLATVLYALGELRYRPARPAWVRAFWSALAAAMGAGAGAGASGRTGHGCPPQVRENAVVPSAKSH